MKLNRTELKKIQYSFNSISNRLLQADYRDFNDVLAKYVNFLTETDIINAYIKSCGEYSEQEVKDAFEKVQIERAIFILGNSTEEEVRNVYAILDYIVKNNIVVYAWLGMSYSHSNKYQDILKDFNNRVTMVLIRHIETYLTNIGIDMGLDDNRYYSFNLNNGQINIANDNSTINATNTINGIRCDDLTKALEEIWKAAEDSNLSGDDLETMSSSLEVIKEETNSEKPRKGFLKTAIAGLQAIKGTAEFGAAVGTIIQILRPLIG